MCQSNDSLHQPSAVVTPLACASAAPTGRFASSALAGEAGVGAARTNSYLSRNAWSSLILAIAVAVGATTTAGANPATAIPPEYHPTEVRLDIVHNLSGPFTRSDPVTRKELQLIGTGEVRRVIGFANGRHPDSVHVTNVASDSILAVVNAFLLASYLDACLPKPRSFTRLAPGVWSIGQVEYKDMPNVWRIDLTLGSYRHSVSFAENRGPQGIEAICVTLFDTAFRNE